MSRVNSTTSLISSQSLTFSSAQLQFSALESGFTREACNIQSLSGMMAGSFAFKISRFTLLKSFSHLAWMNHPMLASSLRGLSWFSATALEVSAFRAASLRPEESIFQTQSWMSSFVDFLALKSGALLNVQSLGLRKFIQDGAVVMGHQIGHALGFNLKATGSIGEQLLQAETLNLGMGLGLSLFHYLSGGRISCLERNSERSIETAGHYLKSHSSHRSVARMAADSHQNFEAKTGTLPGGATFIWNPRMQGRAFPYIIAEQVSVCYRQGNQRWALMGSKAAYRYNSTPLSEIQENLKFDVGQHIALLSRQAKERDQMITVVDWGCGSGEALRTLADQLRLQNISNVRLVGFSGDLYAEWETLPPEITLIYGDAEDFPLNFKEGEIHLIYSHYGLFHLDGHHYDSSNPRWLNFAHDFLKGVRSKLSTGARIVSYPGWVIAYGDRDRMSSQSLRRLGFVNCRVPKVPGYQSIDVLEACLRE